MFAFVSMELVKYGMKLGRVICATIYSHPIAVCSQSDFILTHQISSGKKDVGILSFPMK